MITMKLMLLIMIIIIVTNNFNFIKNNNGLFEKFKGLKNNITKEILIIKE